VPPAIPRAAQVDLDAGEGLTAAFIYAKYRQVCRAASRRVRPRSRDQLCPRLL
jgi:hypothetical protein